MGEECMCDRQRQLQPQGCLRESYKRKKKGHWVNFETDAMQGKGGVTISKAWGHKIRKERFN